MSGEATLSVAPAETSESLAKEIEVLKTKLEEERQKLNDVQRKLQSYDSCTYVVLRKIDLSFTIVVSFPVAVVAERLESISLPNIKPRKLLRGHQAKVLCSDWSPDKRHIVSSSQVSFNIFFLNLLYSTLKCIFLSV